MLKCSKGCKEALFKKLRNGNEVCIMSMGIDDSASYYDNEFTRILVGYFFVESLERGNE